MNCDRCNLDAESVRCGECPTCEAVSKILVVIYAHWLPNEIEELAKNIRGNTTQNLIREFQDKRAFLSARICRLIAHLGHFLPRGADHLKGKVCDALLRQSAHEKACDEWRRKNNVSREQSNRMLAEKIQKITEQGKAARV